MSRRCLRSAFAPAGLDTFKKNSIGVGCQIGRDQPNGERLSSSGRVQNRPNCTSLPPITARIVAGPFEARSLELRVMGAINETEKLTNRPKTISLKNQRFTR
jgi:hypothetical protein